MSKEPKQTRISRRNALGLFGATVSGAAAGPLVLGAGTAEAVPAKSEVTGLTTGSATTPSRACT
ncbi:hypothetical protein PV341_30350 [Streptomyces sp. PA03-1a]|nr:hypothetical protein [Streptomyces sp. PA03-1a]